MAPDPSGLFWDSAWGNGSVEQIWGLGVPFWRLPFECLARIFGQPAFPDRIAFCVALAVSVYVVVRFHFTFSPQPETCPAWVWALVGIIPTVLFPPFLALCRSRFLVYEEVEAYACLLGQLLAAGTAWVCFRPSGRALLCLACVAGLAGFVRPTFGAYGVASLIVASIAFRQNGLPLRPMIWACAIFIFGNGLLAISNTVRFGSPFEFGHSLAINGISAMAYATRFDNPFQNLPFTTAAKELFSLLFFTKEVTGGDAYGFGRFLGQAPTLRWRELYFSTFDVTTLVLAASAWGWLTFSLLRRLAARKGFQKLEPVEGIILWGVIAAVPLIAFYLRFPFMSSRYLMDFSPMLGVGLLGIVLVNVPIHSFVQYEKCLAERCLVPRCRFLVGLGICDFRKQPARLNIPTPNSQLDGGCFANGERQEKAHNPGNSIDLYEWHSIWRYRDTHERIRLETHGRLPCVCHCIYRFTFRYYFGCRTRRRAHCTAIRLRLYSGQSGSRKFETRKYHH